MKESKARASRSDGDITKARIIKEAKELFLQYGPDVTTSKMICEKAKTNIAAVNYHFGSFDGLLAEVRNDIPIPTYEELKTRLTNMSNFMGTMKESPFPVPEDIKNGGDFIEGWFAALAEIERGESYNFEL